jgi:hypothetical protein
MSFLLSLFISFISLVYADLSSDCLEITHQEQVYCVQIEWLLGEQKLQGQFQASNQMSPHWIEMGEVPQRWVYSQAFVRLWSSEDPNQQSVQIPDFKVFAYMTMSNGHHHGANNDEEFFYSEEDEAYVLRRVALNGMRGCWSLRWTFGVPGSLSESERLMSLVSYANIDETQASMISQFCEESG